MYQNEKQQYKVMAVNVVLKLCKLAKQSCNMYEQIRPCRYRCSLEQLRLIMVSFTSQFHLHQIKSLLFCYKVSLFSSPEPKAQGELL